MRKICAITGTRAEYGIMKPILEKIKKSGLLDLQIIATSAHMSYDFGFSIKDIEVDGFHINKKLDNLLSSDTKSSVVKSSGILMVLLSDALNELRPDIVLLVGDRYETFTAAFASMLLNIPIAHIHGGEISIGSLDEYMRHAITKLSMVHFCSNSSAEKRIIQMGENPNRVFNYGSPGLDNIRNLKKLSEHQIESILEWEIDKKFIVFLYHPSSNKDEDILYELEKILKQIKSIGLKTIFIGSNADAGGSIINKILLKFCTSNPKNFKFVKNLDNTTYLNLINKCFCLIGNSSSGIIEAGSFGKPVLNIGDRQKGRLRGLNVIDSSSDDIEKKFKVICSENFLTACKNYKNIYGDGNSSKRIVKKLESIQLKKTKIFFDID